MTIKEKVLQALGPLALSTYDIAEATGLTRNQVGSCLRRLKKQGLVEKSGALWEKPQATYIPTPAVDCPSTVWFRKHADGSVTRLS